MSCLQKDCFEVYALVPGLLREEVTIHIPEFVVLFLRSTLLPSNSLHYWRHLPYYFRSDVDKCRQLYVDIYLIIFLRSTIMLPFDSLEFSCNIEYKLLCFRDSFLIKGGIVPQIKHFLER